MKILVVHRQRHILDMIKAVLDDSKTVVIYYNSGLDALLISRIESFDLIICGIDLPVVTGFELARSVRTISANKNVPIIMISDDVVNSQTEQLGTTLKVCGMLTMKNLNDKLPGMVLQSVNPSPGPPPLSIFGSRLN